MWKTESEKKENGKASRKRKEQESTLRSMLTVCLSYIYRHTHVSILA
jgi:hypothetical protein